MSTPADRRHMIQQLIENSSLGTASARAARRSVPAQRGRAVAQQAARRNADTTRSNQQP